VIVPSDVHAGRHDGDDVDLAANAVLEAAFVVEPVATAKVQAAAAATGGAVERADSQLKTPYVPEPGNGGAHPSTLRGATRPLAALQALA